MAVSTDTDLGTQHFVPFRTAMRGGVDGKEPVATLQGDANATGDASGGTVTANFTMARGAFGFRQIFVPTHISFRDNLATGENIRFSYTQLGNERIRTGLNLDENVVMITALSVQTGLSRGIAIMIEPFDDVAAGCLRAVWATNTNGKAYHMHVFGLLYDAEWIAREGALSELMLGLR